MGYRKGIGPPTICRCSSRAKAYNTDYLWMIGEGKFLGGVYPSGIVSNFNDQRLDVEVLLINGYGIMLGQQLLS